MLKILVIDDDKQIRVLLEHHLRQMGCNVQTVVNGAEGVKLCRKESFDIVFTDINMPEMSGFEVIAVLQEEFPQIRLVAMTGNADMSERLETYSIVENILQKPFSNQEVIDIIG